MSEPSSRSSRSGVNRPFALARPRTANTTVGVVSFGSRASFIGRIADDEFGEIYRHDLITAGVHFAATVAPSRSAP